MATKANGAPTAPLDPPSTLPTPDRSWAARTSTSTIGSTAATSSRAAARSGRRWAEHRDRHRQDRRDHGRDRCIHGIQNQGERAPGGEHSDRGNQHPLSHRGSVRGEQAQSDDRHHLPDGDQNGRPTTGVVEGVAEGEGQHGAGEHADQDGGDDPQDPRRTAHDHPPRSRAPSVIDQPARRTAGAAPRSDVVVPRAQPSTRRRPWDVATIPACARAITPPRPMNRSTTSLRGSVARSQGAKVPVPDGGGRDPGRHARSTLHAAVLT